VPRDRSRSVLRAPLAPSLTLAPYASWAATAVHTTGYLAVTGLVAWVVYTKLGLALLRRAWINLHLIWALALIITAAFTLLI
jgi:hypothetical protein